MTPREAVEALKLINLKIVHPFYSWEEMVEVIDTVIEALKNQIPKKALDKYNCPRCEEQLMGRVNYCEYCGQAIDWGEEE